MLKSSVVQTETRLPILDTHHTLDVLFFLIFFFFAPVIQLNDLYLDETATKFSQRHSIFFSLSLVCMRIDSGGYLSKSVCTIIESVQIRNCKIVIMLIWEWIHECFKTQINSRVKSSNLMFVRLTYGNERI